MSSVKCTFLILATIVFLPVLVGFKGTRTSTVLSDKKWNLSKHLNTVTAGDTIVFRSAGDRGQLLFKSNGVLKQQTWYGFCGNTSRLERRRAERAGLKAIGKWIITESNNTVNLKLELSLKDINLEQISLTKDSIRFCVRSVQISD